MRATAIVLCFSALLWASSTGAYIPTGLSVDFDPPNGLTRIDPALYTTFTACITASSTEGLERVSLTAYVTAGTAVLTGVDLSVFHPEAVTVSGGFGDTENGWIIEAPECVFSGPGDIIVIAELEFFALGMAGEILIGPHPTEGSSCYRCGGPTGPFEFKVCGSGGILQDPIAEPYYLCGLPHTRVICEPQGDGNPSHPTTYWYDVAVGYGAYPFGPCEGFHVQVFDPDIDNYTRWVEPPGWTHADTLVRVGDELWVSWWTPESPGMWCDGWHRFQFDNPNASCWVDWTLTTGMDADPYTDIRSSSWYFGGVHDGYGRRVHAPEAQTGFQAEVGSWGKMKALYR